jgi:uncharacterized protein (TIRG00374 family)
MIVLAIVVFSFIGLNTDWNSTIQSIKDANYVMIGFGSLTMIVAHFLRAYRWNMLTETANYTLNHRRTFYSVMVGYLVNAATSRGGEVVRCALTTKSEKVPVEILIGTVITERIVDLIFMAIMAVLCLLLQFDQFFGFANQYIFTPVLNNLWVLIFIPVFAIIAVVAWKKLIKGSQNNQDSLIGRLMTGIKSIFQLKNPFMFALISLGIWVGYWVGMYFQLHALGITEHFTIANALGLLMFSAVGVVIPLPGGAGVWAVIAYGLEFIYHMDHAQSQTFGIFNIAFSNIFHIIVGAICYLLLFLEIQKLDAKNKISG